MCKLKAKAGKLWNRDKNFNKQKKVSVPTLFFKYKCNIIINCFTLVFNGFDGKQCLKSK